MTRCYALTDTPAPRPGADTTPRDPTYPDRPIAFRKYPVGWWVVVRAVGYCRIVEDRVGYVLVQRNESNAPWSVRLEDVISCTARQVAALESRP